LNQLSFDISRRLEGYSFSNEEFEELSDRIDGLTSLKKKYGDSVEQILKYLEGSREELKNILGRDERLKNLGLEIEKAAENYRTSASQLSGKRLQAGQELAGQVQDALKELGLANAQM